jgi:hypothetical protein
MGANVKYWLLARGIMPDMRMCELTEDNMWMLAFMSDM